MRVSAVQVTKWKHQFLEAGLARMQEIPSGPAGRGPWPSRRYRRGQLIIDIVADLAAQAARMNIEKPSTIAAAAKKAGLEVIDIATADVLRADAAEGRRVAAAAAKAKVEAAVDDAVTNDKIAPARRKHWVSLIEADPGMGDVLAAVPSETAVPMSEVGHSADDTRDQARTAEWFYYRRPSRKLDSVRYRGLTRCVLGISFVVAILTALRPLGIWDGNQWLHHILSTWGAAEWSAFGTLLAVVVALGQSALARSDARREIAANDVQHRSDLKRLERRHRETLEQSRRLHIQELARAEARHKELIERQHAREQSFAMSEVVHAMSGLMIPTQRFCDSLDALGPLYEMSPLEARVINAVQQNQNDYVEWMARLLELHQKMIEAQMIVTQPQVRDVLQSIVDLQLKLRAEVHQQVAVMKLRQPSDTRAIRAAYGELTKLSRTTRDIVVEQLLTRLEHRPGTPSL